MQATLLSSKLDLTAASTAASSSDLLPRKAQRVKKLGDRSLSLQDFQDELSWDVILELPKEADEELSSESLSSDEEAPKLRGRMQKLIQADKYRFLTTMNIPGWKSILEEPSSSSDGESPRLEEQHSEPTPDSQNVRVLSVHEVPSWDEILAETSDEDSSEETASLSDGEDFFSL